MKYTSMLILRKKIRKISIQKHFYKYIHLGVMFLASDIDCSLIQ